MNAADDDDNNDDCARRLHSKWLTVILVYRKSSVSVRCDWRECVAFFFGCGDLVSLFVWPHLFYTPIEQRKSEIGRKIRWKFFWWKNKTKNKHWKIKSFDFSHSHRSLSCVNIVTTWTTVCNVCTKYTYLYIYLSLSLSMNASYKEHLNRLFEKEWKKMFFWK